MLAGGKIEASDREIYEVKNYKTALDWISRKKTLVITSKDILNIHRIFSANVLPKKRSGRYRREPVYVVSRTLISQEIRYTTPDHKKVPKLAQNLCKWIVKARHERLSPIIIAGIAHAEMAAIHPSLGTC